MHVIEISNLVQVTSGHRTKASSQKKRCWFAWLKSPLLFCLLFALVTRLWLIYHSHGLIDGDEAQIGIQALHILKGERPIYFYGQPYMGSLAAYILAVIFAIADTSVWTLRSESLLLSLLLVWLTWKLASALATSAGLTPSMRRWFMTISTFIAALPPLYDAVLEMRVWGGYIETFAFSLLLLYLALRLTQRWKQGRGMLEFAVRWMGIGFIIGLGLWVDALIVIPTFVVALWIGGYCIIMLLQGRGRPQANFWPIVRPLLQGLLPSICAIPAALVSFAPALYWGKHHDWVNIDYLIHPGENVAMPPAVLQKYPTSLSQINGAFYNFITCDAPRVISGITPNIPIQQYKSLRMMIHPNSLDILFYDLTLIILSLCVFFVTVLVVFSFINKNLLLLSVRRLLLLPLLFGISAVAVYCISDRSAKSLLDLCDENSTGRYVAILVLVLPFFVAAALIVIAMFLNGDHQRGPQQDAQKGEISPIGERKKLTSFILKLIPLALLIAYLGAQSLAYIQVPGYQYFRSPFCKPALAHPGEVIDYLQQEHIRYVWASIYIGHVLSLDTHENIIGADPAPVDRIPGYTAATQQAKTAGIIFFARSDDMYPQIRKVLDEQHVKYRVARFHEEPGIDLVVVTPENQNRKVVTFSYAYTLGIWAFGC